MPPAKRRKVEESEHATENGLASGLRDVSKSSTTLDAPISPPAQKSGKHSSEEIQPTGLTNDEAKEQSVEQNSNIEHTTLNPKVVPSPVQLTRVSDLGTTDNVDTVGIKDILGDPLIKECWAFNYCFDVEWLVSNFDEDVRDQIRIVLVHGSWRKESPTRIRIEESVRRHKNIRAITAYIPDPFGTHHSKMFVLIRHDDAAQVVIFTANLLPQDWRMCQAVWRSPLLPKTTSNIPNPTEFAPLFGTGSRFQFDLISYLNAYGGKLKELSGAMRFYDFSAVKACLVASTPSRLTIDNLDIRRNTLWGWPALSHSIRQIPNISGSGGFYVAQVSSIATLGVNPNWLHGTFYRAMQGRPETDSSPNTNYPKLSIVFPTAGEIRRTIDGYSCGGSIHMKLQTAANQKQLKYLMPHLCHWSGDERESQSSGKPRIREAGRRRTGPHIKTYLRFADAAMTRLDWGMVTSANLSKQAWGTDGLGPQREVKISSFEIGVLFWPDMWKEGERPTRMTPAFKKDLPREEEVGGESGRDLWSGTEVGWRMPYDLPLVPYHENEEPWCATKPHLQPDWRGGIWAG